MPFSVLDDPRARDLLAAVPGDVERLASALRQTAADAGAIGREVAAATSDPVWQGAAATAFRRLAGPLPGEMTRIVDGYGAVADALDGYAVELTDLATALRALLPGLAAPEPTAVEARAAARRILDAFEAARDESRRRIAAAQSSAPVFATRAPDADAGTGTTLIGG